MKKVFVLIGLVLVGTVGAAAASAGEAGKRATWTESRADRMVLQGAKVSLPAEDRAALEQELRRAVALFRTLGVETSLNRDEHDAYAAGVNDLANRYASALRKVRGGLEIDAADCSGLGRPVAEGRFSGFRCQVTTESVEIPSTALVVSDDGEISVEGQPRSIGPIYSQADVRVTGKSSFAFRKI